MLPVFLIVVTVSSLALVVMMVGLVRHLKVLVGSVRGFQEELQPVLEQLRTDTEVARERMARASEQAEALRAGSFRRGRR